MAAVPEWIEDFAVRVEHVLVVPDIGADELPLDHRTVPAADGDAVRILLQEAAVHHVGGVRSVRSMRRVVHNSRAVEELHEPIIVRRNDVLSIPRPVHCVDIRAVRRRGPDPHDREAEDARPRVPRCVCVRRVVHGANDFAATCVPQDRLVAPAVRLKSRRVTGEGKSALPWSVRVSCQPRCLPPGGRKRQGQGQGHVLERFDLMGRSQGSHFARAKIYNLS